MIDLGLVLLKLPGIFLPGKNNILGDYNLY